MATVKNPKELIKVTDDLSKSVTIKIKKTNDFSQIRLKPIKLRLDIFILDSILAFLYKDSVLKTNKVLKNFYKLFNCIDQEYYKDNPKLYARFWIIINTLRLIIEERYESYNAIKSDLMESNEANDVIKDIIQDLSNYTIGYEESKRLILKIDDRLRYGYVITIKDIMQDFLDAIDEESYASYKAISEDLYSLANTIVNIHRNSNSLDSDQTFSLDTDKFDECVTSAVNKLQDIMRIFKTGIQGLNTFLAPGYLSKRLYMYLAFPGGGKSQILLKAALDIKKYNPHIVAKDPNKTPAVLLITMENDIDETIERLFNMKVTSEDIRNYTPKQIIRKLKEEGEMTLSDKNNIDIVIKYYANRSIDTNDLYGIIKDLYDDGTEVIALILDYVKRIRPAERANTEKEELKNITNELKTLAKKLDLAVITAQQLNRTASSVVDAAIQNKKEDVTRLVGRDGVAGAWEIIENSDVVIIINQEIKADTGDVYLTFKLLKRRYRSSEDDEKLKRLEYFNHPYEKGNTIKLIDDVDLPESVSLYSLSTQFVSLEETQRGKKSVVQRQDKDSMYQMEFEPFDFNRTDN